MIRRKAFNILTALSGLFHSRELAGSQAGRIIQFSVEADGCRYSLWMWDTIIYAFSARRAFTNEYIDIQQRDLCNECERLVTEAVCQCCAVRYIITLLHHWNLCSVQFVFWRPIMLYNDLISNNVTLTNADAFRWTQPSSIPPPFLGAKMSITSDEVNFLVYRYLQESGLSHFLSAVNML